MKFCALISFLVAVLTPSVDANSYAIAPNAYQASAASSYSSSNTYQAPAASSYSRSNNYQAPAASSYSSSNAYQAPASSYSSSNIHGALNSYGAQSSYSYSPIKTSHGYSSGDVYGYGLDLSRGLIIQPRSVHLFPSYNCIMSILVSVWK